MLNLHSSELNPALAKIYEQYLGQTGSGVAHKLLHTKYQNRKRIEGVTPSLESKSTEKKLNVAVCVGTNCFLKGSDKLLKRLNRYVRENELGEKLELFPTFCFERCGQAPNVYVGEELVDNANIDKVCQVIENQLADSVKNNSVGLGTCPNKGCATTSQGEVKTE